MKIKRPMGRRPRAAAALVMGLVYGIFAGCAVQNEPEPAATAEPAPKPAEITRSDPAHMSSGATGRPAVAVDEMRLLEREVGLTSMLLEQPAAGMNRMAAGKVEFYDQRSRHNLRWPSEPLDRENYEHFDENPVKLVAQHPVSTFSIDVDTGAYSNVRRFLNAGNLPPEDAVRVEELINYFSYDYPVPDSTGRPFTVNTEVAVAPWNADKLLMQIGIKGYEIPAAQRPAANLVFLVDISGSMNSPDKLPLLKNAMKLLTRQMRAQDRVSMVVYAGVSGIVLEPTAGDQHAKIMRALDELRPGGRTNGAGGIRMAYQLAEQAFIEDGINRVMLATDGDFNVGTVDFDALIDLIKRKRDGGISLTTLGFGTGNYNDHLMEQLADSGNGNYAYIDTLSEGRKVLVDELGSTLLTIAKDVKIQVEFNPAVVAEYRLIGYENRMLRREDFNNDKIDAGEIGAGHSVTALYELTLVDSPARLIDPLRYADPTPVERNGAAEIAFVRLRYKAPDEDMSKLIEQPVEQHAIRAADEASDELRFAASVAAFGQLLKGGDYVGDFNFVQVAELATGARGADRNGYRSEFLSLVRLADSLTALSQSAGGQSAGSQSTGALDDQAGHQTGVRAATVR